MEKNKNFLDWMETRGEQGAPLFNTEDEFTYEEYVEDQEAVELEPAPEDSQEFHQWCSDQASTNYEEDRENLRTGKYSNNPVLLTGTVGRWNGRFRIVPQIFDRLEDAIEAVCGGDIIDVEARYNTRCISVNARHHDNSNSYEIFFLKDNFNKEELEDTIESGNFNPDGEKEKKLYVKEITDFLI